MAALRARLHSADQLTSLESGDLPPWYMKVDVQLYDSLGKPGERGTVEEWFLGPGREKRVYTLPSYSATEVRDSGKTYRSKEASYPPSLIETILQEVVHPAPMHKDIDSSKPELRKLKFGKVPLECIMLGQAISGLSSPPIGLFPTYCFDPGKDLPRIAYDFGTQLVVRNTLGTFSGKSVALDVVVRSGETLVATGHVAALTSPPPVPPDMSLENLTELGTQVVNVANGVMSGSLVSKADPIYPESAKREHRAGTVVLHAIIGTDGHVHKLTVLSAPSPDLAVSAIAAVRKWLYAPYKLNGIPTEVETTINVFYTFGPA